MDRHRAAEHVWRIAASLTRPLMRVRAQRLPASGPVLVVAPHPDDEAVGCAGTLLEHRRLGDPVTVAFVTDGGASTSLGLAEREMAEVRRGEAERAAAHLDADMIWFDLPEYGWRTSDVSDKLGEAIDRVEPQLIYAPCRVDGHPVHTQVAEALASALVGQKAIVRCYQATIPLTPLLTNHVFDVSRRADEIDQVFSAHASQRGTIDRTLRMRRYAAAAYGAPKLAEPFWQMTAQEFVALHTDSAGAPLFAGVRTSPVRDPLIYLRGAAARLRLRTRG